VAGGQPDVKANRAVLSMEREDGTWRVGGIDLLRPT
jgi:hypothetical protein